MNTHLEFKDLEDNFNSLSESVDFCSLRFIREQTEELSVRQNVVQPLGNTIDSGVMLTVLHGGGIGYASTSDFSLSGLKSAFEIAKDWAKLSAGRAVTDFSAIAMPHPRAEYQSPVQNPWKSTTLSDKLGYLREASEALGVSEKIVDWASTLRNVDTESLYLTSGGGRVHQHLSHLMPGLTAVANRGTDTQRRTFIDSCQQGGLELLESMGYKDRAQNLSAEAMALLDAPNCPNGKMDLVLEPDQMLLQIHESIGHPLELDRILGDERNYAGTSFVTPEMFGSYQYGSELLNISFDPTHEQELATYKYDDDGSKAEKVMIIEDGILKRPLGGVISQNRGSQEGASSTRACSWNRPPIDRMANLNLEPGKLSRNELIGNVENGILMNTNLSWSIDDSRNKFQFSCEMGRIIKDGELGELVKNPSYRGISATFWRNLKGVGNAESRQFLGTPYCGKGEPNQVIRVGHASPICHFANIDVFGGES
jgi:predicted Zn-dependent protease